MKFSIAILFMGLLVGCSSVQYTPYSEIPQLLLRYPLPTITNDIYRPQFSLNMLLLIDKNGNVETVRLLNTSGSALWDSLAVRSIMKWKYSSARLKGENVPAWIRQKAIVEYLDPVYMELQEILCDNISIADSVYSKLLAGKSFNILAKEYSIASSGKKGGKIGSVNINQYPNEIRENISDLAINGVTMPMKFGNNYLIIKRLNNKQ